VPPATRVKKAVAPTAPSGGPFRGWPAEAIDFFERLEDDNTKTFWTEHKHVYDEAVLAPMLALIAELAPEFGEGRVFRPYRDVRFSRDKSPYKTNIAATNDAGYISLSAESLGTGAGLYMPAPNQLARFRAAIVDDRTGSEVVGIVAALRKKGIEVTAHEELKTAPRGFPADHPRADLLRQKGLTAWKQWPVGFWLTSAAAKRRIVDVLRASGPLRAWLDTNVGPAEGRG
jgi:uncharacterized protein (TIGR02453 family)